MSMPEEITNSAQRYRRREAWSLTPEQRMERFERLQAAAIRTLSSNPQAERAAHRRNHRMRAHSRVKALEAQMKRSSNA